MLFRPRKIRARKAAVEALGVDERGRPVFGYNENNEPVCFARLKHGNGRCMSVIRFSNGRCRMHGGPSCSKNVFTTMSFRKALYKGQLPKELGDILSDAIEDPEAASLKHEMALNTIQISTLISGLGDGSDDVDSGTWKEVLKLTEQLEALIFDPAVQSILALGGAGHKTSKVADVAEKLVLRVRKGADKHKIMTEVNQAVEYRRKLIETELKSAAASRNMIPAKEAVMLFKNLVELFKKHMKDRPEKLKLLARELDNLALSNITHYQDNVLGAKITPGAFVDPSSEVGDSLRLAAEGMPDELEKDDDLFDGETALEMPLEGDVPGKHNRGVSTDEVVIACRRAKTKERELENGEIEIKKIPRKLKFDL